MSKEEESARRKEKYRLKRLAETPEEAEARKAKGRDYLKAYYQANKEAYAERHRRWRAKYPERVKEQREAQYQRRIENGTARKHHLKSRYGITPEDEQTLWDSQEGRCAICRGVFVARDYRRIHLDHDHETGRVRGILCINCNQGMGRFGDNPELLEAAAAFLRR